MQGRPVGRFRVILCELNDSFQGSSGKEHGVMLGFCQGAVCGVGTSKGGYRGVNECQFFGLSIPCILML